jgi:hypothetical protein
MRGWTRDETETNASAVRSAPETPQRRGFTKGIFAPAQSAVLVVTNDEWGLGTLGGRHTVQ